MFGVETKQSVVGLRLQFLKLILRHQCEKYVTNLILFRLRSLFITL